MHELRVNNCYNRLSFSCLEKISTSTYVKIIQKVVRKGRLEEIRLYES